MSSLKDLASLIMVPSLVKDGRLDTVKPLGNSIIHPDATGNNDGTDGSTPAEGNFTFSRGSNLAATRVDVNGLIEKGRENLLTYSNEFDNTSGWTQYSGYTLTSGQTDKDGGTNAWKWESTQSGTAQINNVHNQTGMLTHSIYAKAGNFNVLKIWIGVTAEFNLSTGVVSHSKSKMTDVGNGWWRCEIFSPYTRFNPFFAPTASGQYLYIQDAQAEQGLVATDYIETGASTAQAGILEDLPRLDYSGGASCPSLLLEPLRSNKFLFSEYYGSGALGIYQTGTNTHSVTNNYAVSPEGVQNAIRFVADITSVGDRVVLRDGVSCGGGNHTLTFYAKSNTSDTYTMKMHFDGSGKKQIEVTPEWQRFEYGESANATCNAGIECSSASGYSPSVDISVYGFQLEENLYPTSYIPTYGSAVTRSDDDFVMIPSSNFVQNGGTFMIELEGAPRGAGTSIPFIQFTHTNAASYVGFGATGAWRCRINDNGTSRLVSSPVAHEDNVKLGIRYGDFGYEYYANGSSFSTYSNAIDLGDFSNIAFIMNDNYGILRIKQILAFPTALTDSECIALTTI